MAKICYNRSGGRSLHVSIEFRRAPTNFQEIIGPLATVSLRIESLVLDPTLETRQLALAALHGLNMPNLKGLQLKFTVYKHIWIVPQMPQFPKLEKLSLDNVETSWKAVQYPHLTAVYCNRVPMGNYGGLATFRDLINYITALQHLQSLVLDEISYQGNPNIPTVLDLPSLQSLEISVTFHTASFIEFLSSFNSPRLKHLSLCCSPLIATRGSHIVESLQLTKQFPQVTSLVLREFPDEESIHPQHAMFIARLCPNTTRLKLDSCNFLGILLSKCMDQDGGQEGVLDKLSRMEVTSTQGRSASHGPLYERKCFTSFFKMREQHGHPPLPHLVLNFQNVSRLGGESIYGSHRQGGDQAIHNLIGEITGMVAVLEFAIHYCGD